MVKLWEKLIIDWPKVEKNPEKTLGFWTAKSGKNLEKIGFGQVFSAVLEKIPLFRPKREH